MPTAEFSVAGNPEDVKRNAELGSSPASSDLRGSNGTAELGVGNSNTIEFFCSPDSSDDFNDVLNTLESKGVVISAGTADEYGRDLLPGQA